MVPIPFDSGATHRCTFVGYTPQITIPLAWRTAKVWSPLPHGNGATHRCTHVGHNTQIIVFRTFRIAHYPASRKKIFSFGLDIAKKFPYVMSSCMM
jgi:hypothetical protein